MESCTKDHDLCRHRQYTVSTKIMDVYVYNNALTDLKELCHYISCTCYYFKIGDVYYRHVYVVTFYTLCPWPMHASAAIQCLLTSADPAFLCKFSRSLGNGEL